MAQHHGLATRLLDWSRNPLVAAFFALESPADDDYDSVVYALRYVQAHVVDTRKLPSPWDATQVLIHHPSHVTRRIAAQAGAFTVSANPTISIRERLKSIVISRECRAEMRDRLRIFGVHHSTLFPNLSGQAQFVMALKTPPSTVYPKMSSDQSVDSLNRLRTLIDRSRAASAT